MKSQSFITNEGLLVEIICEGQTVSVSIMAIGSGQTANSVFQQIVAIAQQSYGDPVDGFEI